MGGFWEPDLCVVSTPLGVLCFHAYQNHMGSARVWKGTPITLEDGTLVGAAKEDLRIPWGSISVSPSVSFSSDISELATSDSTSVQFFVPSEPGFYRVPIVVTTSMTPRQPPSRTSLAMMVGLGLF